MAATPGDGGGARRWLRVPGDGGSESDVGSKVMAAALDDGGSVRRWRLR
jgi:hypothetical protein